jgi:hypothetical protein
MAVSSCCIELSADFDSCAACDEAMERICRRKTAWTLAKSPLISSHEMGVMRLDIHENKSMTTRFDFGSMGSLEICHQIFGQKNGEEYENVFGNAKNVKVTQSAAKLVSENQCLLIGTDPKYPFQLAFMSNEGDSHGFFYSFNAKVLNFELSDLLLKQENCLGARIFVPLLYDKKQICFFVKKMTSDLGCAFISGAFVLGRDALFYKALECYGSAQSVLDTLLKQLEEGERNSVFSENDRLKKAIRLCKWDAFGVRSKIFKTLCAQNIDGSIECKESAAKAVLEYINVKGNSDILHVKLPYTVDGILTSRREDVYTHLMRRAEAQREKESREILEHLGYMYYHDDQL